jgi:uncharacterized protein
MSRRRVALITGASSGIGAAVAELFAEGGHDLVLAARRLDPLREMASTMRTRHGVAVRVCRADLSQPGAAERLWAEATDDDSPIDILVNNAGTGLYGDLAHADGAALIRMLQLNVIAVVTLTRLAVPAMLSRGWGRILNVASTTAFQPGGPRMSTYYASKSFVLSFSRGVGRELAGTGVSVTALCPGPTRTAFGERAGVAGTPLYRWFATMDAKRVAAAGYRGLMHQRAVVVPGASAKVMAIAGGLPPRRVALEVNRMLLEPQRTKALP